MREEILKIVSNKKLSKDIYEMIFLGNVGELKAGSFVEIKLPSFTLRRPFGVADSRENSLTILYKEVGAGTKAMSSYKEGDELNVLVELGNGFNLFASKTPLIIAGGMGIAPMYLLAKKLREQGKKVSAIIGARNRDELVYIDRFKDYAEVYVCTDDGSSCTKGNVLDTLKATNIDFDYFYACGPEVMLKALCATSYTGEISLEARMGCGFGACMGCSIKCTDGYKRVCKEGPVFSSKEVIFDD